MIPTGQIFERANEWDYNEMIAESRQTGRQGSNG